MQGGEGSHGHSNGTHGPPGVSSWKYGLQMHLGPGFLQIVVHTFPLPSGLSHVYVLHSFGSHSTHTRFSPHLTLAQVLAEQIKKKYLKFS